jgi:hypothetical protein
LAIKRKILKVVKNIDNIFVNKLGEFTILINGVKFTFFHYPFEIDFKDNLDNFIKMPDLLTLAAMKAYALGQRAKWKDYVDLYFIIKYHFSVASIIKKAKQIFSVEFNEKIFRAQLAYFGDVNYSEKIVYLKSFEVEDKIIKKDLTKFALSDII